MSDFIFFMSWICFVAGGFFCVTGALGLVRMPDFYTRMHAAGITDTVGAGLILLTFGKVFFRKLQLIAVHLGNEFDFTTRKVDLIGNFINRDALMCKPSRFNIFNRVSTLDNFLMRDFILKNFKINLRVT